MAKFVTFSAWQELWEGGAERYELQKITDERWPPDEEGERAGKDKGEAAAFFAGHAVATIILKGESGWFSAHLDDNLCETEASKAFWDWVSPQSVG